jgi:hypothetical protein
VALQRTTTSPFEAIFARYAGDIPLPYLRSLSYRESSFRPDLVHPKSHATGLFQITASALKGFNDANKTALKLGQLTDPELNTRVGAFHLGNVIRVYRRYRSLAPDWSSRRWIELLTLGWNAGHNAIAGLASKMESSGMPPERITVDTVSELARATGRGKYVADPARVGWSKSVATLFLGGGVVPAGGAPSGASTPLVASMIPGVGAGGGGGLALAFALVTAGAVVVFGKRGEP